MDANFTPIVWPEEKAPPEAFDYAQCEVCTNNSRVIWGEGNPQAPIFIILDNPGAREDKAGREYVCGTRETLQRALQQISLTMDEVYITYLLKCRPLRKYDKEKARSFSKPFLEKQIIKAQPDYIVCLGDTVVQSMFDDSKAQVKKLRGSWHTIMGFSAIVSYHPLAVRRRPNLMNQFMQDWKLLEQKLIEN